MNIIGTVLMGLGVLFFGVGLWMLTTALASNSWPTVEGKVVDTHIVARVGRTGDALQRHIEYSIELTYEYAVDQVSYESKMYSLGSGATVEGGFNEKSEARAWLKNSAFDNNPKVTVYVDPNNPTNTVLSSGINWGTWMPLVMSVLFFVLGYFLRKLVVT